jgi:hypothetical protein
MHEISRNCRKEMGCTRRCGLAAFVNPLASKLADGFLKLRSIRFANESVSFWFSI